MAETIDEVTINYEEDGVQIVKELDKVVLSKGAWATVMYKYKEWNRKDEAYGADKYTIRRYRKLRGEFQQQSKFNISSPDQAKKIIETLQRWVSED